MKSPYYIFSPPYRESSAGIKVMYKLCEEIILLGHKAYISNYPNISNELSLNSNFIAPTLTKKIISYYNLKKISPIIIYPETFQKSDKLNGLKINYLLNYRNLNIQKDEFLISYSREIFKNLNKSSKKKNLAILPLLISDKNFFKYKKNINRKGVVYYSGKYEENFNLKVPIYFKNFTKITRDKISSQTKNEIKKIFYNHEVFLCFEDTALALEAMMCGCSVIFIKNKIMKRTILENELSKIRFKYLSLKQIKPFLKKKKLVYINKNLIHSNLSKIENDNKKELKKLIDKTQFLVKRVKNQKFYNLPKVNYFLSSYLIFLINSLIYFGPINFLKILFKRLRFFRFKF